MDAWEKSFESFCLSLIPLIDNDNRVQGSFVSQTRDRWFIKVVLLLAVVGFVGLSMVPLISTTVNESQPSPTATPMA